MIPSNSRVKIFQHNPTRKKIIPLQHGNSVVKEKYQPTGCSNGSLRWAEVWEIVSFFLLNNLANKFAKNCVGL